MPLSTTRLLWIKTRLYFDSELLHTAAYRGEIDLLLDLIEAKDELSLDLNQLDRRFQAPAVYWALLNANYEAIFMLLEAGANPYLGGENSLLENCLSPTHRHLEFFKALLWYNQDYKTVRLGTISAENRMYTKKEKWRPAIEQTLDSVAKVKANSEKANHNIQIAAIKSHDEAVPYYLDASHCLLENAAIFYRASLEAEKAPKDSSANIKLKIAIVKNYQQKVLHYLQDALQKCYAKINTNSLNHKERARYAKLLQQTAVLLMILTDFDTAKSYYEKSAQSYTSLAIAIVSQNSLKAQKYVKHARDIYDHLVEYSEKNNQRHQAKIYRQQMQSISQIPIILSTSEQSKSEIITQADNASSEQLQDYDFPVSRKRIGSKEKGKSSNQDLDETALLIQPGL